MTFNHRFPGQYRDSETGLHQNWNREYDPRLGRYITSDPIGLQAGSNTFANADGTPVSKTDFRGLSSSDCNSTKLADAFFDRFLGFNDTLANEAVSFILGFAVGGSLAAEVGGMTGMAALRHIVEAYVFSPAAYRFGAAIDTAGAVQAAAIRGAVFAAIGKFAIAEAGLALGAYAKAIQDCLKACPNK